MLGQSNESPSNVPEMGCCWGQDEHPLEKGTHEGDDETGGESSEAYSMERSQDGVQKVVELHEVHSLEEGDGQGVPNQEERHHGVKIIIESQAAHSLEESGAQGCQAVRMVAGMSGR